MKEYLCSKDSLHRKETSIHEHLPQTAGMGAVVNECRGRSDRKEKEALTPEEPGKEQARH